MISLIMNLILLFIISIHNQTEPTPSPKAIPLISKGNTNPSIFTDCDRKLKECLSKKCPNKTNLIPLPFSESTPPSRVTENEITKIAQMGKLLSPVDAETQNAMLCEIASRKAREQWLNKKEVITTSLRCRVVAGFVFEREGIGQLQTFIRIRELKGAINDG
jgi:hypothetical protein